MVNNEELINSTVPDAINEVSYKMMSLQSGLIVLENNLQSQAGRCTDIINQQRAQAEKLTMEYLGSECMHATM